MSIPLPFRRRNRRDEARQEWLDERRREARIVVADVANHSDHMLRLACNVLVKHGVTTEEREDARILLAVLDAKSPRRFDRHEPNRESGR
jgi:hypothetical protein